MFDYPPENNSGGFLAYYNYSFLLYSIKQQQIFMKTNKKAFLVEFNVCTRVIIEDFKDPQKDDYAFAELVRKARNKMFENGIEDYICPDNANIQEDLECPYDSEFDTDEK